MNKSLLELFEESGKEVYQVTKQEWINIMCDHHINTCGYSLDNFNKHTKNEVECFHRQEVEKALRNNIEISEDILKDYIGLKDRIQLEIKAEQEAPRLTQDIFNMLNSGDKIKINNGKVTVYKKEDSQLTCKLFKSKTKGIVLNIGDKANITIGW